MATSRRQDGHDYESNNYHLGEAGEEEDHEKDENPSWKTSKTSREFTYYYANRLTHHLNFELFIKAYDYWEVLDRWKKWKHLRGIGGGNR